jgi:murein DD-endopeptidase MepM/ murein hydrolase activator NlpD
MMRNLGMPGTAAVPLTLFFLFCCEQSMSFAKAATRRTTEGEKKVVSPNPSTLIGPQETEVGTSENSDGGLLNAYVRRGGRLIGSDGSLPDLRNMTARTFKARPQERLSGFLSRIGVRKKADRSAWLRAARTVGIPSILKRGEIIKAYQDKSQKAPVLLEFVSKKPSFLSPDRELSRPLMAPPEIVIRSVGLEVERSLREDAVRIGWGREIVAKLMDIFSWQLDFPNEIERGDSVKVIYEEVRRTRKSPKPSVGDILAAEVDSSGKKHVAIYFRSGNEGGYYNENGEALTRPLLRFPVEFSAISSPFAPSRFHPLLRLNRPHFGVDFAAPEGTAVRTIGDGRVVFAGWNGSYGRFVKIQHGPVYSSAYAHLKTIGPNIKVGANVQRGEEIGRVGSSGLSTGPHLHFALFKNDHYVDPFTVQINDRETIPLEAQDQFEKAKNSFIVRLEAISGS